MSQKSRCKNSIRSDSQEQTKLQSPSTADQGMKDESRRSLMSTERNDNARNARRVQQRDEYESERNQVTTSGSGGTKYAIPQPQLALMGKLLSDMSEHQQAPLNDAPKPQLTLMGELLSHLSEDEETTFSEFVGLKHPRRSGRKSRKSKERDGGTRIRHTEHSPFPWRSRDDGCIAVYEYCFGAMDDISLDMKNSTSWDDGDNLKGLTCGELLVVVFE
jgi:hypothetical protein